MTTAAYANMFFNDFPAGKLEEAATGEMLDVRIINIDDDTGIALLYIPGKTQTIGCFIFATTVTDGTFREIRKRSGKDLYSNVGTFRGPQKRRVILYDTHQLPRDSIARIYDLLFTKNVKDKLEQLTRIGDSLIVGNFYFELRPKDTISVREFRQ